jgi:hypothetical protein
MFFVVSQMFCLLN